MEVRIYANSSYDYYADRGGWGTVLVCGERVKEIYGVVRGINQYQACLIAVREGLKALKIEGLDVKIISSYMTLISPLQHLWRIQGRLQAGDQSGQEIWEEVLAIMEHHNVSDEWVIGEGSDEYEKHSMELSKSFRLQRP